MKRGRSRKRHHISRKITDEIDHSQTGQGEEIATPPARRTSPRRGRPEKLTEMNSSNSLQTEPETGMIIIMQPLQSVQMPIIKI
jgi:hypothetical protein